MPDSNPAFDRLTKLTKQILNDKNVTQKRIAKMAGIHASHISQFLSGKRGLSESSAIGLIQALSTVSQEAVEQSGITEELLEGGASPKPKGDPVTSNLLLQMSAYEMYELLAYFQSLGLSAGDLKRLREDKELGETVASLIKRLVRSSE
jgi:predicted transcriptional regulator